MGLERKKLPFFSPASTFESDEFHAYVVKFIPVGTIMCSIVCYGVSLIFIFMVGRETEAHLVKFFFVDQRYIEIQKYGFQSTRGYLGSVVASWVMIPFLIIIILKKYVSSTIRPGLAQPIGWPGVIGIFIHGILAVFLMWLFLYDGFEIGRWSRPGVFVLLLWPLFPALSGFMCTLAALILFSIPAGIYKLASPTLRGL